MTNNEEFEKILENIDENGPAPAEEPERQYYFIKKARALVKKMSEELGRPLISSVTTFGCGMTAMRSRPARTENAISCRKRRQSPMFIPR